MDKTIARMLINDGIKPQNKGFRYLETAIRLVKEDVTYIDHITKRLYPAVAAEHDTTPMRAERAMRHAISCSDHKMVNSAYIILMAKDLLDV